MLQTFAQYLDLSPEASEELLSRPLAVLLGAPEVTQLLDSLDVALLKESLLIAGTVLAQHLPPFYEWLTNELGLQRVPDGPDHATAWVVGFLRNQTTLMHLVDLHRPIPRPALERSIPRLVGLFDQVEPLTIRQEWQKTVAALCLVLAAAARENEQAQQPDIVGVT